MNYGKQTVIIDLIREVTPPFSPEQVCADFARTLKNYNISSISGDRFAGIWPVEQFRKFNIRYEQSAEPKSDLYQSLLPLINSRRFDTVGVIAQFPIRSLRLKTLRFLMRERRNAAATRCAFLLGEGLGHVLGSRITAWG